MKKRYDLIVFGGGPAGYPAAIQAARMGASVLLVEKSGQLGGTTTINRVAFPGIFHAWGRQVIAGIGWELVTRAVTLEGRKLPDFSNSHEPHWKHQIPLCPVLLACLIDEEIKQSGVDLLLHVMPAAIRRLENNRWRVALCGKQGLFDVEGSWIIDATGDANAAHLADCPLMPRSSQLQPATLVFRMGGFDLATIDLDQLDAAAQQALLEGGLQKGDFGWAGSSLRQLLNSRGENAIHLPGVDAVDSPGRTDAELKGRAALIRIYRFLKARPGFENLRFEWCAPECGIRETRSIMGRVVVSYEDYLSGRLWEDAVCYSYYPIDIHTDHGLRYEKLAENVVPSIPLRAMQPLGVPRFLAAGRCISGDQAAHSAFRVQASCMAMGQAAGAVAALAAAADHQEADAVDRKELGDRLREQGAVVPF